MFTKPFNPSAMRISPGFSSSLPEWENPSTRGLQFLFTGVDGTRGYDGVHGMHPTVTSVTDTVGRGRQMTFNGTTEGTSELDFGKNIGTAQMSVGPATWVFVLTVDSRTQHMGVAAQSDNNVATGWNIGRFGVSGFGLSLVRSGNNIHLTTSTNKIPVVTPFTLIITSDAELNPAQGLILVDGVPVQDTFSVGVGTSSATTGENLYLGRCRSPGIAEALGGTIYFAAFITRKMMLEEARSVSRNPWQLVRQARYPRMVA